MDATSNTININAHVTACRQYIDLQKGALWAELTQLLQNRGIDTEGAEALHSDVKPNTILWWGLSEEAAAILRVITENGRYKLMNCPVHFYATVGVPMGLPIGTDRKADFKQPHWVPTIVMPVKRG
jgi:hypothetical protein